MSLNKFKGIGNKVRKVSLLTSHIIDKIDENQNIKRLLSYNTINPLALKGKEYDGDVIDQPNIDYSLFFDKDLIVNGTFDLEAKDMFENSIYVHCYRGEFGDVTGKLYIAISILVPKQYEFLASKGDTRSGLIAHEIENIFDKVYLDSNNCEIVDELGNLKFNLHDYRNERLSKNNTIVLTTLLFNIDITTLKKKV